MNRGPGFAATGGLLAGVRGRLGRGQRTRQGARHRVRGAGRSAPSTPWTGRTISASGPPGSQSPGRHAACLCAVFFSECPPGLLQARLSRAAAASLHLAPVEPGNVPPRCKENTAATEHRGPALQNNPPLPCHLSPALTHRCLLCPTTVSCSQIAPFFTQPTQGQDAGSLGSVRRVESWPPRPTIRLPARRGRRGGWREGGGGRLGRSPSPPCLL